MKVYTLPADVPAPSVDYFNYDHKKALAAEKAHQAELKEWLIGQGMTGKHTGRILQVQIADGYAVYMMADGRGSYLVHLPYGDGYDSPLVSGMTKAGVLAEIERREKMDAFFAKRNGG